MFLPGTFVLKKENPVDTPLNEKDLLAWANEQKNEKTNSYSGLLLHEEFLKIWNDLPPNINEQLKTNIEIIQQNPKEEEILLALNIIKKNIEDIDACIWLVNQKGYDAILSLLDITNIEIRIEAAQILSSIYKNNLSNQPKIDDYGNIKKLINSLNFENVKEAAGKKISMLTNLICGFNDIRFKFFYLNGLEAMMNTCLKFNSFYCEFGILIDNILDNDENDDLLILKGKILPFLIEHKLKFDCEDLISNIISKLK